MADEPEPELEPRGKPRPEWIVIGEVSVHPLGHGDVAFEPDEPDADDSAA